MAGIENRQIREREYCLVKCTVKALLSSPLYKPPPPVSNKTPFGSHVFLRTFARKSSNIDNFIKLLLLIANELLVSEMQE